MRKKTSTVVGLVSLGIVAAFVAGIVAPRVSAQAGHRLAIQVIPVTNGGGTCRDMTGDLRRHHDRWRTPYFNYMAGFITRPTHASRV